MFEPNLKTHILVSEQGNSLITQSIKEHIEQYQRRYTDTVRYPAPLVRVQKCTAQTDMEILSKEPTFSSTEDYLYINPYTCKIYPITEVTKALYL